MGHGPVESTKILRIVARNHSCTLHRGPQPAGRSLFGTKNKSTSQIEGKQKAVSIPLGGKLCDQWRWTREHPFWTPPDLQVADASGQHVMKIKDFALAPNGANPKTAQVRDMYLHDRMPERNEFGHGSDPSPDGAKANIPGETKGGWNVQTGFKCLRKDAKTPTPGAYSTQDFECRWLARSLSDAEFPTESVPPRNAA